MSSLYQGIIYDNNIPIYDILLKSTSIKLSLWYLIRMYCEENKFDLYESYLFLKMKDCISNKNNNSFKLSYINFSFKNNDIISTLLFMMSNDIITLSNIYNWTLEFNTIYPNNTIIIKQRYILDIDTRLFISNITSYKVKQNNKSNHRKSFQKKNFIDHSSNKLNNTHKYLSNNIIESILNKKNYNTQKKNIANNKKNYSSIKKNNYKLIPYPKLFSSNEALIDRYNNWLYNNRFNKYTLKSLLLLDSKK